jgi:hypothetical protein
MMMLLESFLGLFIGLYLIMLLARYFLSSRLSNLQEEFKQQSGFSNPNENSITKMVQCEFCRAYFPNQEGVFHKGKLFCTIEHAEKYF